MSWNPEAQGTQALMRFASKSQAKQRAGRTGRTCGGTVFRLMEAPAFEALPDWERPGILLASLREECLRLCCSGLAGGAAGLLAQCLDPPDAKRVDGAMAALVAMRAVRVTAAGKRGRGPSHGPTQYGQVLADMPLALPQARLAVAAAANGLLVEGCLLAALLEQVPAPIQRPFADPHTYARNLGRFGAPPPEDASAADIAYANFAAVRHFELACHWRPLVAKLAAEACGHENGEGSEDGWGEACPAEAREWCTRRKLLHSSVVAALEMASHLEGVLHKRSRDLQAANSDIAGGGGLGWLHTAGLRTADSDAGPAMAEGAPALLGPAAHETLSELLRCTASAGAAPSPAAPPPSPTAPRTPSLGGLSGPPPPACVLFKRGSCAKPDCRFSHDAAAVMPLCRNFQSPQGCPFGASCRYLHAADQAELDAMADKVAGFVTGDGRIALSAAPGEECLLGSRRGALWQAAAEPGGAILLLGEGNFGFSASLRSFSARRIIATANQPRKEALALFGASSASPLGRLLADERHTVLFDVDATRLHRDARLGSELAAHGCSLVVWNFPFSGQDEDAAVHQQLLRSVFASLTRLWARSECDFAFGIALQGDQFTRWRAHTTSRAHGWALQAAEPFDALSFPGYQPKRNASNDNFPVKDPMMYLFRMAAAVSDAMDDAIAAAA